MQDMPLLEEKVLVPVSRPQRRVLIVAQQIELRARIARMLQSAGYTVELAGSRTRALKLAAGKKIEAAIVVHSSDLNGLGQELREQIPRMIMLDHRTDEIRRPEHPFRGTDAPAQAFDEQKLLDQLREPMALPGGARDGTCGTEKLIMTLTSREWEVATLVAKGLSNKQIARHLNVGEGTVKIHLHNIYGKLAVKNRTVLALMTQRVIESGCSEDRKGGAALAEAVAAA